MTMLTMLRRQNSKDSAGPSQRRPSWTGALGARLGKILPTPDDGDSIASEDTYATAAESSESIGSLQKPYRGVVVGGKIDGE